jgi:hypothetical protein
MKSRYCGLLLILTIGIVSCAAKAQSRSNDKWRDAKPKTVTLFSRAKYKDKFEGYGKSAFSFKHGVRSDVGERMRPNNYDRNGNLLRSDPGERLTRNTFELQYGGINLNGDSDWFTVTMVRDACGRIKDLGELNWSGVSAVPYLPLPVGSQTGIRFPSPNETFEESSNGKVTKVVAGHIYVVRTWQSESIPFVNGLPAYSKDTYSDFYYLVRVEKLVPSDQVTISWKAVPSPKQKNKKVRDGCA